MYLHPAGYFQVAMKGVVSTLGILQKLASHAQSAQKTIAKALAKGSVTSVWSRSAASTFSFRLGPGVMEDADTQSFILLVFVPHFLSLVFFGNQW